MSVRVIDPVTIVGVERNYGAPTGNHPRLFLRPPTCVIGDGDTIMMPPVSAHVAVQCEIGIVVGRRAHAIAPSDFDDYVAGFTCLNDVTALDLFLRTDIGAAAKWFDTFMPAGPRVVPTLPKGGVEMTAAVNGVVRLRGHSSQLAVGFADLVSAVSQLMTLLPGDIVMSGGPGRPPQVFPGDVVEIEIEGIGTLRNDVRAL